MQIAAGAIAGRNTVLQQVALVKRELNDNGELTRLPEMIEALARLSHVWPQSEKTRFQTELIAIRNQLLQLESVAQRM